MNATPEQLADEARRARKVRHLVDLATALITQSRMSRDDAERLVELVRARILGLFPGREATYDLIYAPRFRRLIAEFTAPGASQPAVIVPFPGRRP